MLLHGPRAFAKGPDPVPHGSQRRECRLHAQSRIRDAALKNYGTRAPGSPTVLAKDSSFAHNQWTSQDGAVFESFEHGYETASLGPWTYAKGHCYPGSTVDPQAPQYALPCKGPNAFVWGREVMKFFLAHPMP